MTKPNRLKNSPLHASTGQKLRVLIAAADPTERQHLYEHLQKLEGTTLRFRASDSIVANEAPGSDHEIDAVLLSPGALTEAAREIITQWRYTWPDAGLVVLTDEGNEADALVAIALGADEVLSRQETSLTRLHRALVTSAARRRYHAAREQAAHAYSKRGPLAPGESRMSDLALEPSAAPQHAGAAFPIAPMEPPHGDPGPLEREQAVAAPKEGEDYYRQLVENSPDILFRLRLDGDLYVDYVNPAISRLIGYSAEEWIANPNLLLERTHPEDRLKITEAILNRDVNAFDAFRVQRKDGTTIWMAQRLRILSEPDATPILLEGTLRDITMRIRAKEEEQEQRILAEVLRETVLLLSGTLDLDVIFERLLANVQRVVPLDAANIMLLDSGIARVARSMGRNEQNVGAQLSDISFEIDQLPHMHRAISTRQTQTIGDTRTDPRWVIRPETAWIRSYMVVPICAGDEVIGLLNVDSATPGMFDEVHAGRLQVFADEAAIAIRNAQLYTAEREGRALVEALRQIASTLNSTLDLDDVMHKILKSVETVVPSDAANIMLIEDGYAQISYWRDYTPEIVNIFNHLRIPVTGTANLEQMVLTRSPIVIPDTGQWAFWKNLPGLLHPIRSYVAAPIQVNGQVIGFVNLDSLTPGFFTPEHAERLQVFADEAAIAIQNAQLFAQVRLHADELEERVRQRTLDLHRKQEEIEAILDGSTDAILLVSPRGFVRHSNAAARHLLTHHASPTTCRSRIWLSLSSARCYPIRWRS